MPDSISAVVLDPSCDPIASVIWLHGLGADGNDFVPIAQQLGLLERGVRFVFPNAPIRPVTLNGGLPMRAWYDLFSPEFGSREDATGIEQSSAAMVRLLQQEQDRGIAPQRLVLAGFSQGGAIALHAGLRLCQRLAGVIALSTYLPLAASLDQQLSPKAAGLPVFIGHGRHDPLIPLDLARQCRQRLARAGLTVAWHDYPVEHGVDPDEVEDIGRWLEQVLAI